MINQRVSKWLRSAITLVWLFSTGAVADDEVDPVLPPEDPLAPAEVPSTFQNVIRSLMRPWVFASIDIGRIGVRSYETGETNKAGGFLAVRGFGDFYFSDWTLEAGGGVDSFAVHGSHSQRVNNSGLLLDVSMRYRVESDDENLEVGLEHLTMFGKNSSFSSTSDADKTSRFIGLSVILHPSESENSRVGLSFLGDYSIKMRTVGIIFLSYQYGFDSSGF